MAAEDREKEPLLDRIRRVALRPAPEGPGKPRPFDELTTVDEIQSTINRADDLERLVGLIAAPLAAMIGLLVTASLIANDPKAHLANGAINKAHVNPSLYTEIGGVAVLLAVLMLAMAWFRKRVYLGIAMALYGLSIFNLKFWGFGIPFVMAGAWYLVRAYRLQTKLKGAQADQGSSGSGSGSANKRYTPKSLPPRGTPKQNGKERRAG
jgi:hypothetical protein